MCVAGYCGNVCFNVTNKMQYQLICEVYMWMQHTVLVSLKLTFRKYPAIHTSVLPRIEKGHGAARGKRALLFAKLHFKGTFAHVIIF